jgi:hypothetical protein
MLAESVKRKLIKILSRLWKRPIHKRDVQGIHGTLYYDYKEKAKYLPASKREIDRAAGQLNGPERKLYAGLRKTCGNRK